jgi:hypothetical protein
MDHHAPTTRLYSSLSEPRPIMGMDWRLCWTAGLMLVAAVVFLPFGSGFAYAPTLACGLTSYWITRFGKRLWSYNPYFIDEYWIHVRTPLSSGADEQRS